MTITIVIADDEPLVRGGLRALLEAEADMSVVAEASDGTEAIDLVEQHRPDVMLMDVRMPRTDGIAATRHLSAAETGPKIIVVTTFENDTYVFDALAAGAQGFLLKRDAPDHVVHAVRTVNRADALLFPDSVRDLVASRVNHDGVWVKELERLTERERDVLHLIAQGKSNADIAGQLFLGVETVKTHVRNVLSKLGVKDRVQAVIVAYESGFVRTGQS